MKRIIKEYFSFSRREAAAAITLLILAGVFLALPHFFAPKVVMPVMDTALANFVARNRSAQVDHDAGTNVSKNITSENNPVISGTFDPNELDEQGWIKLGVKPRTAATIIKYRSKGGRFRSASDISKIWGLSPSLAGRIIPHVRISTLPNTGFTKEKIDKTTTATHAVILDINTATVEDWRALRGIGDVLANRIVNYRRRIGGFADIKQVKKVYGISDSLFTQVEPFLTLTLSNIPLLDINTVNQFTLAARTGIPPELARAIINFRKQYGPFKTLQDLRKLVLVTDSVFENVRAHVAIKEENGP